MGFIYKIVSSETDKIYIGQTTKSISKRWNGHMSAYKEYVATVTLGATTPSFDLETPVDATYPTDHITAEGMKKVMM